MKPWGLRLVAAFFVAAFIGTVARADAYHDQFYSVYNSTAAPQHYKRAAAKILKLPAPVQNIKPLSRPSVRTITLSTPRGATAMQLSCGTLSPLCRPMTLRGVPAGATVNIYARSGALFKTLVVDATGTASWDGTNQSGVAAPGGIYTVAVQVAGGSATFGVTVQ
jgi:hypothetical protein